MQAGEAMTMYSSIQRSFEALDDKTGIEEWRTWFPGFDGDLETTHKVYARNVVEKEHRFTDLKPSTEDFDSHTPMVKRYRRMIENRDELTREDIISILASSEIGAGALYLPNCAPRLYRSTLSEKGAIRLMLYALILWIIVGLIAGAIARSIMPGDYPGGMIVTIIICIVGAVIGGWLLTFLGPGKATTGGSIWSIGAYLWAIISGVIGALILLFIYRALASRRV
jgi:uncharacterized membrane protein YeaQ/YmgE (transglycosylase-associated protein family)